MNWIFFAIIAPFFSAITHLFDRYLEVSKVHHFAVLLWLFYLVKIILVLMLVPFVDMGTTDLGRAVLIGSFIALANLIYFKAITDEEVSRVAPLWLMVPLFVLLLSYFTLPQELTMHQYSAFALLLIGGIVMSSHRLKEMLKPSRTFWLMMLSGVALAMSEVLAKTLYVTHEFWANFAAIRVGELGFATCMVLIFYGLNRDSIKASFREAKNKRAMSLVLLVELIGVTGVAAHEFALKMGPVSIVSLLNVTSPVFVFLITATLWRMLPSPLQESHSRQVILQKAVGLFMMGIGVGILVVTQ